MSLSKSLKEITASGFEKMPHSIAKVLNDGIDELKTNKLAANALQVGSKIPDIPLITSDTSREVSLKEFIKNDFLILNFYRGGWCPYCNLELRAYEQIKEPLEQVGADIVSISTELPQIATSTSSCNNLTHKIVTDLDAKLSKAIGINFQLNKDLQREYSNFGINLAELHGNNENELQVPAVFILDKDMKIIWSHIEENYMTRAEPNEVLSIVSHMHISKNAFNIDN